MASALFAPAHKSDDSADARRIAENARKAANLNTALTAFHAPSNSRVKHDAEPKTKSGNGIQTIMGGPMLERLAAVLCDQLAKLHAGTDGSRAAHIAKGWRALTMMFMLQALHRRDGGSLSLHFRQSLLAECATLRRRAGTHFLRGGARLATDVLPN